MSTIKMVEVTNFRNIKHMSLLLKDSTSIITGKNKLGKSNFLNAINWILTDSLLTDKYGVGENDIESIVPKSHIKGEHTEVSITLDNGTVYTKIYKVGYTADGSKINKHTTEYKINGVPKATQREFYNELYNEFNYQPSFYALKINEVRLMTNPLYALLIIDPKELRKLLVAVGCSVSNEEVYQRGFDYMRTYEAQYKGKWDDLRLAAKEDLKQKKLLQENHQSQLSLFNALEVDSYDATKIEELQQERDSLISKITEIRMISTSDLIKDIDNQIKEAELDEKLKLSERNTLINEKIKSLKEKASNINLEVERKYQEDTKPVKDEIDKSQKELIKCKSDLVNILNDKSKLYNRKFVLLGQIETMQKKIEDAGELLAEALMPDNQIVCPHCGKSFVNLGVKDFNIENQKKTITDYQTILNAKQEESKTIENEISYVLGREQSTLTLIDNLDKQIKELTTQLNGIKKQEINVADINNEISSLENELYKPLEASKLAELRVLKENTINNTIQEKQKQINEITEKVNNLNELIAKEIKLKNDAERKQDLLKALEQDQDDINKAEYFLQQINSFIHTMMRMINDKAKEITGFDFTMLEENLTNGNLVEVCYATIDGVPFKDINTADKIKYGIKFMERIRELANTKNTLPVLIDRLESVSNIEDIRGFSNYQLICTRVNTNEEMRVE